MSVTHRAIYGTTVATTHVRFVRGRGHDIAEGSALNFMQELCVLIGITIFISMKTGAMSLIRIIMYDLIANV